MLRVPMQITHFGYRFGDLNSSGQIHPGYDLNWGNSPNADLGLPIYPLTDGEVVYAENTNNAWGLLQVIYYPSLNMWSRYAHLKEFYFKKGDQIGRDDIAAACGKSGTSSAHCHFDLIKQELPNWQKYTTGMSMDQVLEWYEDGLAFIDKYNAEHHDVSDDPLVSVMMQGNSNNWGFIEELKNLGKISEEQAVAAKTHLNECNNIFRGQ